MVRHSYLSVDQCSDKARASSSRPPSAAGLGRDFPVTKREQGVKRRLDMDAEKSKAPKVFA